MGRNDGMHRHEVWRELENRGATRAVVFFSGGNDEGCADSITLYAGKEKVAELQEYGDYDQQKGEYIENPDTRLATALAAPVYGKYGSFAGEFSVDGEVVWDLATKQATLRDDYRSTAGGNYGEPEAV
jgi:hypothetical protein